MFEKAFEFTQLNFPGALMTSGQFYKYAQLQLKKWFRNENFHTYLVDANNHTYLPQTMDTATPDSYAGGTVKPAMIKWLYRIVHQNGLKPLRTVCYGPSYPVNFWTIARRETDYCAKVLAGIRS